MGVSGCGGWQGAGAEVPTSTIARPSRQAARPSVSRRPPMPCFATWWGSSIVYACTPTAIPYGPGRYKSADPTLGALEISLPLPVKTPLTGPPDGTRPESALKLRGRVVTFKKDCVLKDVLVLVQAKSTDYGAWRVVGPATTPPSGNFGMPYPAWDLRAGPGARVAGADRIGGHSDRREKG